MKFQVDYAGRHWSDSDALFACMKRAMDNGTPILDGKYLAQMTRPDLERIFAGNIEMPMLDEKMQVWRQVGAVLAEKYNGRFHNFVKSCPPRLYDNGAGIIDRMVAEFPRFNDISLYDGATIKFYKLPQLGIWLAYSALRKNNQLPLEDIGKMTAFADYIVPVALRLLGIVSYSTELEHAINTYQMIPRDSRQEVEIRAHCIYATALLCEEINNIRPKDQQIIIPQIDARLWTHYHTTWWPHHSDKNDHVLIADFRLRNFMATIHILALTTLSAGVVPGCIVLSVLRPTSADAATRGKYLVYIGTYTDHGSKGIYAYRFDARTGQSTALGLAAESAQPSFLAVDAGGHFLYAVNEIESYEGQATGAVSAFAIDAASGKLSLLNQVSSRDRWAGPHRARPDRQVRLRVELHARQRGGFSGIKRWPPGRGVGLCAASRRRRRQGTARAASCPRGRHVV